MKNLVDTKEPIGAVIKRADDVNTNLLRRTAKYGTFNRIEWQFFNYIKRKNSASTEQVIDFLSFFGSKQVIQELINRFRWDGLITAEQGNISITSEGENVYEEVLERQEEIKEKAMAGITEKDYNTTIETLYRIMGNLKDFLPTEEEKEQSENNDLIVYSKDSTTEHSGDIQSIKQVIAEIEKTFNQKDPDRFANLFENDAVFVNAIGMRLRGRESIYNSAKKMMSSSLSQSYAKYEITGIRFIKKDVVIVEVIQRSIHRNGELLEGEPGGVPTYVLVKDAKIDQWKIIAGQNTFLNKS